MRQGIDTSRELHHDIDLMEFIQISSRLLGLVLFFLTACTTPPIESPSQNVLRPHLRGGMETLAILGTNDIHGNLAPIRMKTHDSIEYETGGVANIASYVDVLRSEFGEHMIWLDAGDEFQGTIESNSNGGAPMVQFYNSKQLNAAAIGNHEFDYGIPVLKSRMKEAQYPYLSANIFDRGTDRPASFPNTFPYTLITIGHLKVGVVGLSTLDTPTTTRPMNVKNLRFENLKAATLREATTLRKLGANVVLLTAHVGLDCSPGRTSPAYHLRKPTDPQGECGPNDEMVRLLNSLPTGTVDAVIAGHTHKIIHHWIAGVPVIQAGSYGRYLNVIYLTYDWSQDKVLTDLTRIEGPIPVCTKVFQNQNDCNGDRPAPKNGRGLLVPPRFHGQTIHPSKAIMELIEPVLRKSEALKTTQLGFAKRKIEHFSKKEGKHSESTGDSPLGNLIADAIRKSAKTDFALVNSGAIRASINSGSITYGEVYRTFPFDNAVSILKVTGSELLDILRLAESGSRGLGSVSGLKLKLIAPDLEAPFEDLTGDGKYEAWKVNRLLDVKKSDGTPILPDQWYTLGTVDFLVAGGDDMSWAMSKIPADRIQLDTGVLVRDALVTMIQDSGPLNSEEHPLVNPMALRLQFEKPASHDSKKNHKDHHKRKRRRRHRS